MLWSTGFVVARRRGTACVNLKYRGDLRAFLTLADLHAQLTARQHGLVAGTFQYSNVEEGIARAIAQLNEPKPLFRIEPFDGGINRGPRRDRIRARRLLK